MPADLKTVHTVKVAAGGRVFARPLRLAAPAVPDIGLLPVITDAVKAEVDTAVVRVLPFRAVGQKRLAGLVENVVIRLDRRVGQHLVLRHGSRVEGEARVADGRPL